MHIGGLRTALFNWLFARHYNGKFILRIEDTDQNRYSDDAESLIYEALGWLGLDIDEGVREGGEFGPYRQSERLAIYHQWARWLVEQDKAYYDYTTSEELEALRVHQQANGIPPGYDRRHRDISDAERAKLKAEGRPEVIRFKMPLTGQSVIHDMLRDEPIIFENDQLNDLVLLKSDGYPTYHLANVIDDHLMQISHILRANEWVPSAPVHLQLYAAFGWEMPKIAHLPVLLNPSGPGKMSKRELQDAKGNVIPVLVHRYKELGFLPEAMFNFLANIGWTYGEDQELYTRAEAIARFDGTHINPSNSAFPADKLRWYNGVYIREKITPVDLAERLRPVLEAEGLTVDERKLQIMTPAVQTRIETLNDVIPLAAFVFRDPMAFTPATAEEHIQKGMDLAAVRKVLDVSQAFLPTLDYNDAASMEAPMRQLAVDSGFKVGQLFGVLRHATSAQQIAPPLFDVFAALGKEETLRRIQLSVDVVESALQKAE
jgi:glutamyl-tRNA synthetase